MLEGQYYVSDIGSGIYALQQVGREDNRDLNRRGIICTSPSEADLTKAAERLNRRQVGVARKVHP